MLVHHIIRVTNANIAATLCFSLLKKIWFAILDSRAIKFYSAFKASVIHHDLYTLLLLIYLLTYLLTPWSRVLFKKLASSQLVKKFPAFYGTRRFITAFTSARQLSLSCASLIHSIPPHPTSWRSILILSSHLCLGLPSGLLPPGFPTKTLYPPLLSPICATWTAHLIFDFIIRTIWGEQYRSIRSSLCSFSTPLSPCPS